MSPRTGSLPDYLQENYRSAEQMKVWWKKWHSEHKNTAGEVETADTSPEAGKGS